LRRRGAYSGGTGSGSVGDGPREGHGGSTGVIGSGSSGSGEGAGVGSVIWTSVVRGRSPMSVLFRQPYDQRQLCRAAAKGCRHQNGAGQGWQDGSRRRLAAEHLLGLVRGQLCPAQATSGLCHRVAASSTKSLSTKGHGTLVTGRGSPSATCWRTTSSWLLAWCRLRLSWRRQASSPLVQPLPLAHFSSSRREGKQRPAPCR